MSKQNKFYVSHEDQQLGPFTIDEIIEKVKAMEFSVVDYIFDEKSQDWVSLMEHEQLKSALQKTKPKAPPADEKKQDSEKHEYVAGTDENIDNSDNMTSEWYILKGENKFGPFAYTEVIKMLQEKLVFEFDFAWKPGMESWVRVAEVEAFNYEKVKQLKKTLMPEIEEVFFRRRHKRALFGGTILIHDNVKLWKGEGVEISAGGAGVIMENSMIIPGQKLYLHFKPGDGVPPFNTICEVVSKKYLDGVNKKDAPIRYGLKFMDLNEDTKNFLLDYTSKKQEAA